MKRILPLAMAPAGGLEYRHDSAARINNGVFGLQARGGEFSALGEEAFIPRTDNTGLGLFVLEEYHSAAWTFEAGRSLEARLRYTF